MNAEKLTKAISDLVEYNFDDELEDYRSIDEESRKGHIFETIVALQNFVDGDTTTPQSYVERVPDDDDPLTQCSNSECGIQRPESELDDVGDLHERVWPGEPMPSGQCPVCGALCHRVNAEADKEKAPR